MNPTVRVSFDQSEQTNVEFLMKHLGYGNAQKLIRYLIAEKSAQVRATDLRYGRGGGPDAPPKETKGDARLRIMREMSEEKDLTALTARIEEMGGFAHIRKSPDDQIFVFEDEAQRRIVRRIGADDGMTDDKQWGFFINDLKTNKII